jgi:hypothetical protein
LEHDSKYLLLFCCSFERTHCFWSVAQLVFQINSMACVECNLSDSLFKNDVIPRSSNFRPERRFSFGVVVAEEFCEYLLQSNWQVFRAADPCTTIGSTHSPHKQVFGSQ